MRLTRLFHNPFRCLQNSYIVAEAYFDSCVMSQGMASAMIKFIYLCDILFYYPSDAMLRSANICLSVCVRWVPHVVMSARRKLAPRFSRGGEVGAMVSILRDFGPDLGIVI